MADIQAFRGFRYDTEALEDELDRLLAPPYDVIDDEEQAELYARHSHNVVRLILNIINDEDSDENNRYTRARRHLMDWLASGAMIQEPDEAIYVHYQTFVDPASGEEMTRRGFISRFKLANYEEEIVLPHERTLRGPKEDRLKLFKAVECNLSQVFLLFDDAEQRCDEALAAARGPQLFDVTTPDGIRHQLWAVYEEQAIETVKDFMCAEQVLIADGHHRYETALAYRDFRREIAEELHDDAPYEYGMGFFVNMHDPGLLVLPTHRVVHDLDEFFGLPELVGKLAASHLYDFQEVDRALLLEDPDQVRSKLAEAGARGPSFMLATPQEERMTLVTYVGDTEATIFDEETPDEVRALDVCVLHEGILDRELGISKEAQEAKTNLYYRKKWDEAVADLDSERTQLVVFMNATPVAQVDEVCRGGGKMPQKSTYFYPKILSGLVINPL